MQVLLEKTWPTVSAEKVGSTEPFAQWGLSATGHWRAAICRLTEDKERCTLNLYINVRFSFHHENSSDQ